MSLKGLSREDFMASISDHTGFERDYHKRLGHRTRVCRCDMVRHNDNDIVSVSKTHVERFLQVAC